MRSTYFLAAASLLVIGAGCARTPVADRPAPAVAPAPVETGTVKELVLTAEKKTIELKPGLSTEAWTYGGAVPGPEVRVKLGDRVRITLKNDLDQPTTIHWHGIRVPAGMDGVPGVSQEPVPPGGTFVYEFVPPDAGTFFYHSHVDVDDQVDRGLYGAFVVEPAAGLSMRDGVFALDDWLLDAKGGRLPTESSGPELDIDNSLDVVSEAAVGVPSGHAGHMMADGGMMMGSMGSGGMMDHAIPDAINGRFGNVMTVNGRASGSVEPIRMAKGERFLARFLNASNAMTHELKASDGRALAIVAVDGRLLARPFVTDRLVLPPAKRFDVVLESKDGKDWALEGGTGVRAIRIPVTVEGEAETAPLPDGVAAPDPGLDDAKPDATFAVSTDRMMNATTWLVNGRPFDMEGENPPVATFRRDTWVKLRFTNGSPMAHTMHVHGHFMQVIARNGQRVNVATSEDTVVVRAMETVDVVMLADNPGDWVVHCHNLEHEEHGLMAKLIIE